MAKERENYICSSCGHTFPKWLGKCPQCQEWNTIVPLSHHPRKASQPKYLPLNQVPEEGEERITLPFREIQRVLGGGLVRGSLVLLGGEPGVGKSTLLLQIASALSTMGEKILYVSAEETLHQIKLRAKRLGSLPANLYLLQETRVEAILGQKELLKPGIMILDSIQTVALEDLPSSPGTVVQVREATARILEAAKATNTTVILVGHVTKEGSLAGPKTLEHMVDTVLQIEGDKGQPYRLLRVIKNRYGPDMEVALLEMTGKGIEEVKDPSAIFLQERLQETPGSVVVASLQGSKPLLLEVQALVSPSSLGIPRRVMAGVDPTRASFILAVIEKHLGLNLQSLDLFLNIPGGIKLSEPGGDLAVLLSLVSSFREIPIEKDLAVFGEVGLGGEIRRVKGAIYRAREAEKHGFSGILLPKWDQEKVAKECKIKLIGISNVREALEFSMNL
ncbi:MAG: DNA repair protein RadA [Aquificota bacterium]|nr:MAG: DNA repair protein RadA [Aquificota bacterium]